MIIVLSLTWSKLDNAGFTYESQNGGSILIRFIYKDIN
jgi:hypothetical protein